MLTLKKLLGKDDKFFDLLEAGAEEAKTSVDLFSAYLKKAATSGSGTSGALDEFIERCVASRRAIEAGDAEAVRRMLEDGKSRREFFTAVFK